jgi:transcription termination factor Rho
MKPTDIIEFLNEEMNKRKTNKVFLEAMNMD